jgi:hypothetical protein
MAGSGADRSSIIVGRATFRMEPSTVDIKMPAETVRNAAHFCKDGFFKLLMALLITYQS